MVERPILMSGPMVRAILEGRKTQTRRVIKVQPVQSKTDPAVYGWGGEDGCFYATTDTDDLVCPYGVPGDRLWVRETWTVHFPQYIKDADEPTCYRADYSNKELRETLLPSWRPSIHMPRARCRLVLEVTGVRVERLQAISDADALAEGVEHLPQCVGPGIDHRTSYVALWDSLNAKRAPWASNPWVWVVEFRRLDER